MKHLTLALGIVVCGGCSFNVAGDNNVQRRRRRSVAAGRRFRRRSISPAAAAATWSMPPDIAGLPIVCTAGRASCNGSTLVTCPDGTAQVMTTCALGCSTTGGAHCELMYPRAPVTRDDFDTTGLTRDQHHRRRRHQHRQRAHRRRRTRRSATPTPTPTPTRCTTASAFTPSPSPGRRPSSASTRSSR